MTVLKRYTGSDWEVVGCPQSGTTVPSCRVYRTTTQSINNNTATAIAFDAERFDNDTMHSTVSNTERITCTTAGVYVVSGSLYTSTTSSSGVRELYVRRNGTDYLCGVTFTGQNNAMFMNVGTIFKMAATDYFELVYYQSSGGSFTVASTASYTPEFAAAKVGDG